GGTMKFKPYSKYVDSGVEWLGEIPEGWTFLRIGFVFFRIKETGFPDFALLSVYRDYGVIPKDSRDDNFNNASEDLTTYQLVRPSDLVINKMKAWQGSLGISKYTGIVSPAYYVLHPYEKTESLFSLQFINCLIRSQGYFSEFEKRSKGIRINQWDLPYEEFKTIPLLFPSIRAQRTIASFLDSSTARIDSLIQDYEDLIALLQEKRQALISHAVTRGLSELVRPDDPDFGEWAKPMKFVDSGVEWLGEIPEGWVVKKLRYIVPSVTVGIVVNPSAYYVDDGVPCLRSFNISGGKIDRTDLVYISSESNALHSKSILHKGDIVVVRTGQTGIPAIVEDDFDGTNCIDLLIIRKSSIISTDFLYHYLSSDLTKRQVEIDSVGTIQVHYNTSTLSTLLVVLSPSELQVSISSFLSRETAKIDALVKETQDAIELLKEHRTALITNAVTGKINVEEWTEA
ncbi:MAG TPA: restriction endonuclease subunit S, partial [Spirochaetia bacterium]|nr:restriction endonuclease subunit S [Spirochaetia bacterium]